MYDGNIVLLAFFLGMVFGLYAEQVIRNVVYFLVSTAMGLPTLRATDAEESAPSQSVSNADNLSNSDGSAVTTRRS